MTFSGFSVCPPSLAGTTSIRQQCSLIGLDMPEFMKQTDFETKSRLYHLIPFSYKPSIWNFHPSDNPCYKIAKHKSRARGKPPDHGLSRLLHNIGGLSDSHKVHPSDRPPFKRKKAVREKMSTAR